MPAEVLDLLTGQLGLDDSGVYQAHGLLALAGFFALHGLDRPELKEPVFAPTTQPALADPDGGSIFDRIRRNDLLVHLPYESFTTSVGAFLAEASLDPDVVAIKQTLYRTWSPEDPAAGGEASVVQSLIQRRARRQAGGRPGRAEGPLRRGGQHHLGPAARRGRSPRGLRGGRPQDPCQDRPGGAARGGPPGALQPHRHGQLQPADGPPLRRPGPAHRRRGHRRRPQRALQRAHRVQRAAAVPEAAGGPDPPAPPGAGPHPLPGGARRAHRLEDEPPGGRRDRGRALRRLRRRGRHRPDRAGAVLPAARGARPVGAHPGALPGGQVPGALPGDALRRGPPTRPTSSARPT